MVHYRKVTYRWLDEEGWLKVLSPITDNLSIMFLLKPSTVVQLVHTSFVSYIALEEYSLPSKFGRDSLVFIAFSSTAEKLLQVVYIHFQLQTLIIMLYGSFTIYHLKAVAEIIQFQSL